jgi:hypothetical protein
MEALGQQTSSALWQRKAPRRRGWQCADLGGRRHEREREREREIIVFMCVPLLCGGNGSRSARQPWWKGIWGEVRLMGWNGAFGPSELGIDSYLY